MADPKPRPKRRSIDKTASHAQEPTDENVPDHADSADAQTAYAAVLATLGAMSEAVVVTPSVDVFAATDRARQLAAQIMADEALVARFRHVAGIKEFDLALLTELTTRSLAASHARGLLVKARKGSLAKVPKATIDAATIVCNRMKALAIYLFGKRPDEMKKVAEILANKGYHDLADDLRELAALYGRHPTYVVKDPVNYDPTDKDNAERLSREIVAALGRDPAAARTEASDTAARAWTHFWHAWSEVAQLGRWLLRDTPERAGALFPMLLGEVRAAPQAAVPVVTAPPSASGDPASPVVTAPAATSPASAAASKPRKKARGKKR